MNKKERKALEDALLEAQLLKAMYIGECVLPDVLPPTAYGELSVGFTYNTHTATVTPACSSICGHSSYRNDRTQLQGTLALYSTERRAYKALRHSMALNFAERLHEVDKAIQKLDAEDVDK